MRILADWLQMGATMTGRTGDVIVIAPSLPRRRIGSRREAQFIMRIVRLRELRERRRFVVETPDMPRTLIVMAMGSAANDGREATNDRG